MVLKVFTVLRGLTGWKAGVRTPRTNHCPSPLRPGGSTGVTLIELLVSMSLSVVVVGLALALFKDVGLAARLGSGRRDAAFHSQTSFNSITNSLMTGAGILRIGRDRLVILNRKNRRMEYKWSDSTLSLNGKSLPFRLASLEINPEGPDRPEARDFSVQPAWDLDSLDDDRNGRIGFEELDRDGSGELEPEECRFIARISITMKTVQRDLLSVRQAAVHPRNRIPARPGVEPEDAADGWGIPDP